jgi:hypothetical protein
VFHTPTGDVAVLDFMAPGHPDPTIHRIVEGRNGTVRMRCELVVRFDYGSITPWVRATGDGLTMVAGPDGLRFHSPVRLEGLDHTTVAGFEVAEGERFAFSLTWFASQVSEAPLPLDSLAALQRTRHWWREWVAGCTYDGEWRDDVVRSLITLKALTYGPTGAVCAAATTSLPEHIGGVRNWDYRYSWLRDATLTLQALLITGKVDEAVDWSSWLRRAVAGDPGQFQIMYGVGGERRLTELELDWLSGYEDSRPVRIGNEASTQFQLDVFGEVMDAALPDSVCHPETDLRMPGTRNASAGRQPPGVRDHHPAQRQRCIGDLHPARHRDGHPIPGAGDPPPRPPHRTPLFCARPHQADPAGLWRLYRRSGYRRSHAAGGAGRAGNGACGRRGTAVALSGRLTLPHLRETLPR